jgi:hypothetical protein
MNVKMYVVSLDAPARRDAQSTEKMHELLRSTDGVEILEGAGRKTTKVRMSELARKVLKRSLPYLTISRYEDLDLLGTTNRLGR